MEQSGSSVKDMIEEGQLFDGVVIPSDNYNLKKYRKRLVREDEKPFTQNDVALLLKLTDAALISNVERNEVRLDDRTYSTFLLATGNHPNYDLEYFVEGTADIDKLIINPPCTPEDIKQDRMNIVGLQQRQISSLLGLHIKTFGKYESSSAKRENRRIPTAHTWTLFLLITNQHPCYKLVPKAEGSNAKLDPTPSNNKTMVSRDYLRL